VALELDAVGELRGDLLTVQAGDERKSHVHPSGHSRGSPAVAVLDPARLRHHSTAAPCWRDKPARPAAAGDEHDVRDRRLCPRKICQCTRALRAPDGAGLWAGETQCEAILQIAEQLEGPEHVEQRETFEENGRDLTTDT
jgi:hypothetical protein